MAISLRTPLTPISLPSPIPTTRRHFSISTVRCGPRDNRGPLVKGRILSIEAIHAVQSLKLGKSNHQITNALERLLKADLLAVLNELIRQNHCDLALRVFSVVRSEPWYTPDLATYAVFVRALQKNEMIEEIDRLVGELEREVGGYGTVKWGGDDKSLAKLIRALAEAGRKDSIVMVYRMMKKGGWGVDESGVKVDEYVAKVLARGLRVLGEVELAKEVDSAYESFERACLQRFVAP